VRKTRRSFGAYMRVCHAFCGLRGTGIERKLALNVLRTRITSPTNVRSATRRKTQRPRTLTSPQPLRAPCVRTACTLRLAASGS